MGNSGDPATLLSTQIGAAQRPQRAGDGQILIQICRNNSQRAHVAGNLDGHTRPTRRLTIPTAGAAVAARPTIPAAAGKDRGK
jgi:hypothetical protein